MCQCVFPCSAPCSGGVPPKAELVFRLPLAQRNKCSAFILSVYAGVAAKRNTFPPGTGTACIFVPPVFRFVFRPMFARCPMCQRFSPHMPQYSDSCSDLYSVCVPFRVPPDPKTEHMCSASYTRINTGRSAKSGTLFGVFRLRCSAYTSLPSHSRLILRT